MEGYTYGGERSAAIVDDGRGDGGYWRVRQRGWIVREEEKGRRGELAVQIVVPRLVAMELHLPHR
jgi:hypothetical protein